MKNMIKQNTSSCSPNILEILFNTNCNSMKNEIEKVLEERFLCPSRFAQEIESIAQIHKMTYIDSILFFCEKNNYDIESIPKLISKPLKDKLKYEAMELNFLKKTSRAKLPL